MNTQSFTKEQLSKWEEYERVRQSGEFNMFDYRARNSTSLTTGEWVFCIENYRALQKAAGESK